MSAAIAWRSGPAARANRRLALIGASFAKRLQNKRTCAKMIKNALYTRTHSSTCMYTIMYTYMGEKWITRRSPYLFPAGIYTHVLINYSMHSGFWRFAWSSRGLDDLRCLAFTARSPSNAASMSFVANLSMKKPFERSRAPFQVHVHAELRPRHLDLYRNLRAQHVGWHHQLVPGPGIDSSRLFFAPDNCSKRSPQRSSKRSLQMPCASLQNSASSEAT